MPLLLPEPGHVLLTRSNSFTGAAIRFGAALRDRPNLVNHVAVMHHTDAHGIPWVLEGRPGGVGWRDARDYLTSRWTITNTRQPLTTAQQTAITHGALRMIGTPYDWEAIAADAAGSAGIPLAEAWTAGPTTPGHVVCSSLAAYLYYKAGAPHPNGDRLVTPADWEAFITEHSYA